MKSKSVVNVKKDLVNDIMNGAFKYGAILAESYWMETKDGFIKESTPTTSELLDGWFYPFKPTIKNYKVYINHWFTSVRVEELTESGGVHVERLVFKPELETQAAPPGFISSECWQNFREHWSAND